MHHSPSTFSHKERRLIYKVVPKGPKKTTGNAPLNAEQQKEALKKKLEDLFTKRGIEGATAEFVRQSLESTTTDQVEAQVLTEKLNSTNATRKDLESLQQRIGTVEFKFNKADKVETVSFKKGADNPVPTPNSAPQLDSDKNRLISPEVENKIKEAGSKLGQTIKSFIEALMPLIKSLQKIVNDIKKMIAEIVEDFKYDGSKLATEDKYIDKQIKDPEADPKFIQKHFANAQAEKNKIDTELSSIPGDSVTEKQGNLQEKIKNGQEDVNAMTKQISAAPDAEAEAQLTKDRDFASRKVQKLQTQFNGISAKIERRAVLVARLERIETVATARNITLAGVATASATAATAEKPDKAAEAEKAKKAAWDAYNNLQVVLSGIDSTQSEVLEAVEIDTPMKAFNTAIEGLEEDAVKAILKEIGIYTVDDAGGKIYETTELDKYGAEKFKLVYKNPSLTIDLNDIGDNE